MRENLFLTIHGHFYQPPREDPWLDIIEEQPDASPYHDWNEKIFHESYKPNAMARILDEALYIEEIINNFEYLSFNIGPTLLFWLEKKHPFVLKKIQEADKRSLSRHNGHGNAIAQVYNHVIMPLAHPRDQTTQVDWGIQVFQWFFDRKPEGMWLAETAINYEVVETLIEHGIRFTVLSPYQAAKIRKLEGSSRSWEKVEPGKIPSHKPYRIFSRRSPDKYIDVFFYHPTLAQKFAFDEEMFHDAHNLKGELKQQVPSHIEEPYLLNIAVDGETFGHHKAFADMCLAYFFKHLNKDFHITNYGEFLDKCPPRKEVALDLGEDGKGSSWSCSHGVGRWERDCGCRAHDSYPGNHQWRTPLRHLFDALNEKLWKEYSRFIKSLGKDPLQVRHAYLPLRRYPEQQEYKEKFLSRFFPDISSDKKIQLFSLLESQYFGQLMFSSCAWFFDDPAELGTIQSMRYALKASEETACWASLDYRTLFLKYLKSVYSHYKERKGKKLLEDFVFSSSLDRSRLASCIALNYDRYAEEDEIMTLGPLYDVEIKERFSFKLPVSGNKGVLFSFRHRLTGESYQYASLAWWDSGDFNFEIFITDVMEKSFDLAKVMSRLKKVISSSQEKSTLQNFHEALSREFPRGRFLSLADMPREYRYNCLRDITVDRMLEEVENPARFIRRLEKSRSFFHKQGVDFSPMFKNFLFHFLQANLFALLNRHKLSLSLFNSALESLAELHIPPHNEVFRCCFKELFDRYTSHLSSLSEKELHQMLKTLQLMKKADIDVRQTALQDAFYLYIRSYEKEYIDTPLYYIRDSEHEYRLELLIRLADLLSIAAPGLKKIYNRLHRS